MQINWFTVVAQIINFLTLVWLLKRFLYKPVLKAIDEREKKVADQLSSAAAKMDEARKEKIDFQKKNEAFDQSREEKMKKIEAAAAEEKQKLFDMARTESESLRNNLQAELKHEQQQLKAEIMRKTQQEVFAIAGKTLADLADENLEEMTVRVFLSRLYNLKEEEKKQLLAAFQNSDNKIIVRSALNLPDTQRSQIEKALKEVSHENGGVSFEVKPGLISGIEMSANGYKLSWNIASYLDAMEKNIAGLLPEEKV